MWRLSGLVGGQMGLHAQLRAVPASDCEFASGLCVYNLLHAHRNAALLVLGLPYV